MRQTMEAKKYGHDEDPDVPQEIISQGAPLALDTPGPRKDTSFGPPAQDISGNGFDYSQDVSTSQFNVQVRIDSNGETILDEESLFVDRTAEEDTTNYVQVEESDVTKFVNSGTYSRRFRCSRWSAEETELFYQVHHSSHPFERQDTEIIIGAVSIWGKLRTYFVCASWKGSKSM